MFLKLGLSGEVSSDELLHACPAVLDARREDGLWRLRVDDLQAALRQSLALADARQLTINEVGMDRPTLEEAFLTFLQQEQSPEGTQP